METVHPITAPGIHALCINDAAGEIFRLDMDGKVAADIGRIRAAAARPEPVDYVILCRALVWALDQPGRLQLSEEP